MRIVTEVKASDDALRKRATGADLTELDCVVLGAVE